MNSRDLTKELTGAGWILDRVKGSHHAFRHPHRNHTVTVPPPKKELAVGLVKAIRKQAGI